MVVSIFVNPTQFAPHEDLDRYPRTLPSDLEALGGLGTEVPVVVFSPSTSDLYPLGVTQEVSKQEGAFVEVIGKSEQMEGAIRPHFFRGVATIVTKLFHCTEPNRVYFGQKDAQQCAVVRTLIQDLCFPVEMVVVETVREEDGLALSSRNRYLSSEAREQAPCLYRGLSSAQKAFEAGELNRSVLLDLVKAEIPTGVEVEYISLADPTTLREIEERVQEGQGGILSGAVRLGPTRIIDNVLLGCRL